MKKSLVISVASIFALLLFSSLIVVTFKQELTGLMQGKSSGNSMGLPPEFDRLAEVWSLIQKEHVDREIIDAEVLSEGAVKGLLLALNDPYASYLNAEQFKMESSDYQGYFEGSGAQVTMRDGHLIIIAPMPGSPA